MISRLALAAFPQVFNKVFISLIRAGELSGQLTEVFENLGTTLRWQDELIAQTRKLLIYPAMVFFVVGAVVIFLLLYLVPQIVGLLKTMGLELPLQTRILIALSEFTASYWYLLLIVPVALISTWPAVAVAQRGLVGVRFRIIGEDGTAIPTRRCGRVT